MFQGKGQRLSRSKMVVIHEEYSNEMKQTRSHVTWWGKGRLFRLDPEEEEEDFNGRGPVGCGSSRGR